MNVLKIWLDEGKIDNGLKERLELAVDRHVDELRNEKELIETAQGCGFTGCEDDEEAAMEYVKAGLLDSEEYLFELLRGWFPGRYCSEEFLGYEL